MDDKGKGKGKGSLPGGGSMPVDGSSDGASAQELGTMLRWQSEKGFGFIKRDRGGDDIFCHVSKLLDGDGSVREGDRVVFTVEFDTRKGKDRATQVRVAPARCQCRYGAGCYRANQQHRIDFCASWRS